jgi:uncharacterized membrane protein
VEVPDEASELRDLRARLAQLEQRITALEQIDQGRQPSTSAPPRKPESMESGFGLTFINRIGAVTLAIGIILLFKYAADVQGIGATARVAAGLLAGLLLIGAGEWLRRRNQSVFAQGVAGCGLAIIYIAFYAAHAYYHLIGTTAALVAIAATCVLAFALYFRFDHVFLAPWNAFLVLMASAAILTPQHPLGFALTALALAIAHFAANRRASKMLHLVGHLCLLTAGLRALDVWIQPFTAPLDRASVTSEAYSILLALYGVAVIVIGVWRRSSVDRLLGLTLLGLVVAKLYIYDVWLLDRFYRITAFVVLGLLLLGSSYLYSRFRDKLDVLLK